MRLDLLQLDLRPRPNAQALDLGFTLLRANALHVYLAWLGLWLPLVLGCIAVDRLLLDAPVGLAFWLPWWLRPLLERAPLYVLSRQVFGERVSAVQALRAWPRQLAGGWLRLLTWWRPFMPGRGFYQPIWQLEGSRGGVAGRRIRLLKRGGAGRSAFWFGFACAHLEVILQIGLVSFIGLFLSDEYQANPWLFLRHLRQQEGVILLQFYLAWALAVALMGPIYVACCFTLYLNRRATQEAWDLEIRLRQLRPPAQRAGAALKRGRGLPRLLLPFVALMALCPAPRAEAAAPQRCEGAGQMDRHAASSARAATPEQKRLRQALEELYRGEELRPYRCREVRRLKEPDEPIDTEAAERVEDDFDVDARLGGSGLPDVAAVFKILLIAAGIGAVVWLLYRYRGPLGELVRRPGPRAATEVAGLDIRPESLPRDVPAEIMLLWERGRAREALALLYRATLARLVADDGLVIAAGSTEGDCLRLAAQARRAARLTPGRYGMAERATELWRLGAYGGRWPRTEDVRDACAGWRASFGLGEPAP